MNVSWLLMHGRSVQGIFIGRKTQTRRIVKCRNGEQPTELGLSHIDGNMWASPTNLDGLVDRNAFCPYGQPGDLIYVREAWRTGEKLDQQNATEIANSCRNAGFRVGPEPACPIRYEAPGLLVRPWGDNDLEDFGPWGRYRHARFMPRWASRITLRLTDVRVERVQEISEQDATEEGAPMVHYGDAFEIPARLMDRQGFPTYSAVYGFQLLWDDTNGAGAWNRNEWCWVLCFDVIHANVDQVLEDPELYGIREVA